MSMSLACGIACDLTSATGLAEVTLSVDCRPTPPASACQGWLGRGVDSLFWPVWVLAPFPLREVRVTAASWAERRQIEGGGGEWLRGSGPRGVFTLSSIGSLKPNTWYLTVSPSGAAM